MKNMIKMAGGAAVALALTQTLHATNIMGNIGFTGSVTYDTSSAGTATEVTGWINPQVSPSTPTGSFFGVVLPGQLVQFTTGDWLFNDATTINPFWMVDGFTFELTSSHIINQVATTPGTDGYVVVDGTGMVSGNGYASTVMTWSFTSRDPIAGADPDSWSFSASANSVNSVPDGGATVMLLGIALSGVALLRKKLTA
jgi:hypothetical protein